MGSFIPCSSVPLFISSVIIMPNEAIVYKCKSEGNVTIESIQSIGKMYLPLQIIIIYHSASG
jgi:hypothetical protein